MRCITRIDAYKSKNRAALTLGKFDGVHRGHQKLIDKVCEYASENKIDSVVCAFDMGREVLMTQEEKADYLEGKVDTLVFWKFTKDLREMAAEDFIRKILVGKFHAAYIVVGKDFRFGYEKRGDAAMLKKYAPVYGYEVEIIEKEVYGGQNISSTYIRKCLAEGNLYDVNRMLGYVYHINGTVEHGKKLGRTLGFPTMNVVPAQEKLMPHFGVYACNVYIDGEWYHGIGNVGVKPTVSSQKKMLVEVYVYGYTGNAYGKQIIVEFAEFERSEKKFHSITELKKQVDEDKKYGKKYFGILD